MAISKLPLSPRFDGRPDRFRTCDTLIKSQVLYQLSYGPQILAAGTSTSNIWSRQAPVNQLIAFASDFLDDIGQMFDIEYNQGVPVPL